MQNGCVWWTRREIWYYFTCPGTFHALLTAFAGLFTGQGWSFVPPQRPNKLRKLRHKKSSEGGTQKAAVPEWCAPQPCAAWERLMEVRCSVYWLGCPCF